MPLGASRLNFLAKTQEAAAVEQRTAKTITAYSTAQIDTAQSKFGGSSYLNNGSSDYLEIDGMTSPGTGDFTVEFWFRSTLDGNLNDGLFHWSATGFSTVGGVNGRGLALALRNPSQFGIYNGDNTNTIGGSFSANTWYHAAVVRSSGTLTVYIDGSSIYSVSDTQNYDGIGKIAIGAYYNATFGINGNIDEFRVSTVARYTSGFTPSTTPFVNDANTQLLIHADGTDGDTVFIDDNGDRAPVGLVAINDTQISTAQSKFGSSSFLFDGTGDSLDAYITSDYTDIGTGDVTFECWINSSGGNTIFDARISTNTNVPLLQVISGNVKLWWNNAYAITHSTTISTGTWYHVALVRSSGDWEIYVNGVASGSPYTGTDALPSGTETVRIGLNRPGTSSWNGYIDEFRISNTARYTTGFTAPTAAFENDSNTLLLLHAEEGAVNSTHIFDDNNFSLPYIIGQAKTGADNNNTSSFKTAGLFDTSGRTQLTFSGWVYVNSYTSGNLMFFEDYGGGAYGLTARCDIDGGYLTASAWNTSTSRQWLGGYGNTDVQLGGGTINTGEWIHLMCCIDSANPSTNPPYFYVNGVDAGDYQGYKPTSTWTWNTDPAFGSDTFGFGARSGNSLRPDARYADWWFDHTYIDLTVLSNRQKFYNSGPVDLGSDGTTPTGTTPMNYFSGPFWQFPKNRGDGNPVKQVYGGGFTPTDGPGA